MYKKKKKKGKRGRRGVWALFLVNAANCERRSLAPFIFYVHFSILEKKVFSSKKIFVNIEFNEHSENIFHSIFQFNELI